MIKSGVWGSGLRYRPGYALRRVIRDATAAGFPIVAIEKEMAGLGKSLVFQQEEIDELLETPSEIARVYPLLGLLYPGVNVRALFHEDHVFPKSRFTRKRLLGAGVAEAEVNGYMDKVNRLPNLQLLEGPVNIAKLAALPAAWANPLPHSGRA